VSPRSLGTRTNQQLRSSPVVCEEGPVPVSRAHQRQREFHRLTSAKAGPRVVMCVGPLAADAVMMAEGDPDIVALCDRPLRVHGSIGTRPHFTFDLAVTARSGIRRLYAVFRESTLRPAEDGRLLPKHWAIVERLATDHGHDVHVLTDTELEQHRQRITNWRRLLPFVLEAHHRPNPAVVKDLLEILRDRAGVPLLALPELLVAKAVPDIVPSIARLLHEGVCEAQLDVKEFTGATPITVRGEDDA